MVQESPSLTGVAGVPQMVLAALEWAIETGGSRFDGLRAFVASTNRSDDGPGEHGPGCDGPFNCVCPPAPATQPELTDKSLSALDIRIWNRLVGKPVSPVAPVAPAVLTGTVPRPSYGTRPVHGPCPNQAEWGDESLSCPNVPFGHDCDCVVGMPGRHYKH